MEGAMIMIEQADRGQDICFSLKLDCRGGKQVSDDTSFIGGIPRLPVGTPLPECLICGSELTFFFQVAFPAQHWWRGLSLAMFACTACADPSFLIPQTVREYLASEVLAGRMDSKMFQRFSAPQLRGIR